MSSQKHTRHCLLDPSSRSCCSSVGSNKMMKDYCDFWPTFGNGRCKFCKHNFTKEELAHKRTEVLKNHFKFNERKWNNYRDWDLLECRKRRSSLYWIIVENIQKNRDKYNLNGMPQDIIYHCDPC